MSTAPLLQQIPTLFILPTPDNPRSAIDQSAPAFLELVESIRAKGILQPLLARPHPTIPDYYDLRAGERRYRAGLAAGLQDLPVIVRHMDDRTAMEITVLENLQRQDLSPLEEARGIRSLLDSGHTPAEIAAELGKSPGWIARRAKLLTLTAAWRKFADKHHAPAAHLELIARYPAEIQDRLADTILDSHDDGHSHFFGPDSLSTLKEELADIMHELRLAPFPTDDELLHPVAGSCTACPKRSGCQPDLFTQDTQGDACLDTDCWSAKRKAHLTRQEAALRQEHPNLIKVLGPQAGYRSDDRNILSSYDYKIVKPTTAGAVPALIVRGQGEGEVKYILPEKHSTEAKKVVTKANTTAAAEDPKAAAAALKEKRAMLEKRRLAHVADALKAALEQAKSPPDHLRVHELLALIAVFGTGHPTDHHLLGISNPWRLYDQMEMDKPRAAAAVWSRLVPQLIAKLTIFTVSDLGEPHRQAIDRITSDILALDPHALFADATAAIPEPKSWAALETKAASKPKAKPVGVPPSGGPSKPRPKAKGITQDGSIIDAGETVATTAPDPAAEWTPEAQTPAAPTKRGRGRPRKATAA